MLIASIEAYIEKLIIVLCVHVLPEWNIARSHGSYLSDWYSSQREEDPEVGVLCVQGPGGYAHVQCWGLGPQ